MSDYREEMNQSYWEGFIQYMAEHFRQYTLGNPSKEAYQVAPPVLRPGVQIAAGMNRKGEESIRVHVTMTNTPKEWFTQLQTNRKVIDAEVGISDGRWEWEERQGKAEFHIILRKSACLDGAELRSMNGWQPPLTDFT